MRTSQQQRLLRALPLGVMWGMAAGAMEAVALPVLDERWSSFGLLLLSNMCAWSVVGVGIALLVECVQWRVERPFLLAVAIVVAALAFSAVASWIFSIRQVPGPGLGIARVLRTMDPLGSFLYQAWVVVFYGGLYAIAWTFNARAERTRDLLDRARIARIHSETLLAEAQLHALRGHVDPRFLLRVIHEIDRRYTIVPADADRLVNHLVAFLRLAMPGVRSGCSSLRAEMALARSYAALWSDLERDRATWQIDAVETRADMPFPPLLLLPLLDRLASAWTGRGRGHVIVARRNDGTELAFHADGVVGSDWLTAELAYRVRVAMSTQFGSDWSMDFRNAAQSAAPALRILIRTRYTTGDEPSDSASSFTASPSKGVVT